MVFAHELGKRFGARWVFRRLEFCVAQGECLLVTGVNGSGKSTLLRVLVGLETPSEGQMESSGFRIGYTAPDLRLYPSLNGAEHMELAAKLRGSDTRVDLLEEVGLPGAVGPTSSYSTGMRARLKLALALQASPDLLILDEPGAGLDESGRSLLDGVIQAQKGRGAVIVATNDPLERRYGDLELRLGG
ncbi:MAG: ABC transporter ATP-binding protein [Fimbriimonadales bacterium]